VSGSSGLRWLVLAVTFVVIAALVAGVVVLGPPSEARKRRLDQRRVEDLVGIQAAVRSYAGQHDAVPPDLSALDQAPRPAMRRKDPETGMPYEYEAVGAHVYRLCAVFSARSDEADSTLPYSGEAWHHDSGRQCFERHEPAPER